MTEDGIPLKVALIPLYGYLKIVKLSKFSPLKKAAIVFENMGLYSVIGFFFGLAQFDTPSAFTIIITTFVSMYVLELALIFGLGDKIRILGWPEMKALAKEKGYRVAAAEITVSSIYHAIVVFFVGLGLGVFVVNGFMV